MTDSSSTAVSCHGISTIPLPTSQATNVASGSGKRKKRKAAAAQFATANTATTIENRQRKKQKATRHDRVFGKGVIVIKVDPLSVSFDRNYPTYVIDDLRTFDRGEVLKAPDKSEANVILLSQIANRKQDSKRGVTVVSKWSDNKHMLAHKCRSNGIRLSVQTEAKYRNLLASPEWQHHCCSSSGHKIKAGAGAARYIRFGMSRNFRTGYIERSCSIKKDTNDEYKEFIKEQMNKLATYIENSGKSRYSPEYMKTLNEHFANNNLSDVTIGCRALATHLTAMNGYYWPPVQAAKVRGTYSTLWCLSPRGDIDPVLERPVLFYFVLPTCDTAIPVFTGDSIVFDPSVPHCITEPRFDNIWIAVVDSSVNTCRDHILQNIKRLC